MFAAACTNNAKIEGNLDGASLTEVVVKLLNVNKYEVLDTVKTDVSGRFTYKMNVTKGQPEFVYLFHKDTKVASLLIEAGDKVKVQADTLGNYTVEGSVESEKLAQVERNYAAAYNRLETLVEEFSAADNKKAAELQSEISKEYVNYYRECVRYILTNSHSMTIIPVLYQSFGPELPVFGQGTDALHFKSAADSLEMVYPDSKYVKALRKEAESRFNYLEVSALLSNAQEVGYPEIELPDVQGKKVKLTDIEATSKVTMLYFWNPSNASQKMFNLDFLKSVYTDYHKRGFEIYQVALDPDKAAWAKVVKEQALPWINVCDGLGAQSPYILQYNLGVLPSGYIICDGTLVDGQIVDEKSLRKLLNNLLK